jgi:polyhydroxyalkanoate synthesis repressor PhaR
MRNLRQCGTLVNQTFANAQVFYGRENFVKRPWKQIKWPDGAEFRNLLCAIAGIIWLQMTTPQPSADKFLDIRKYPNRRYYDTTHSRHLTLDEIRSLISDGYDIKVTDSKSGADITAQVLTQIILELETPKIDSFPVALLLRMIRSNDKVVRDFVETYFNQAFKAYSEYQQQIEERVRQMHGVTGMFPPFEAWSQAAMAPFMTPFASKPAPSPGAGPEETSGESQDLRESVASLQQQLAAMREEMKSQKTKRRST